MGEGVTEEDLNIRRNTRRLIWRALDITKGDQTAAAKLLGVDRSTLHYQLGKWAKEDAAAEASALALAPSECSVGT